VRARVDQTRDEDLLARGETAAALRLFEQAHRLTSSLIVESPRDPDAIFAHAQSEYWIGRVHELREEWSDAERHYAGFAALTDRLIRTAPTNPDYMMQVGWAAIDLGNLQLRGKADPEAAQRSYEKAVTWFGRATMARPGDGRASLALANAHGWLADSFYARSKWSESLAARLKQHDIVEALYRRDPSNRETTYRLALAQRAVGHSFRMLGDRRKAGPALMAAHRSAVLLNGQDPGNAEWLLFRGLSACDLLFGKVGFPAGTSENDLRGEVENVVAALNAQRNPRVSELGRCVNALNQ
jgi:tetratricopeptide (TPR) repeat protein